MIRVKKRLGRGILALLFLILLTILVWAAAPKLTFNAPANASATANNWTLLNITVEDDEGATMDIKIYGDNTSLISNKSLIYRQGSVADGTVITYNWTAPKQNLSSDMILLMYFDNQTDEGNLSELSVDSNMVLLMHFNNDSSVNENYNSSNGSIIYDYSNSSNNGTMYVGADNSGNYNSSGEKFNGAFTFDGVDDYIDYGNGSILNFGTGNFSVEFWLKLETVVTSSGIGKYSDSPSTGWLLYTDTGGGNNWITVDLYNGSDFIDYNSKNLNANQWYHIAMVRSEDTFKLYIDGVFDNEETKSGFASMDSIAPLEIGRVFDTEYFNGTIDEVAIYNRSLTLDEIRQHAWVKILDETKINNGTRANGTSFNYSGKLGPALEFDGTDDYALINDSDSLDLTENFSIALWVYPDDLSSNQTLITKGNGTTTNYFIDFKNDSVNTKIEFGFYNGDWRSVSVDASNFNQNAWNLIVATRNTTLNYSTIYINGESRGSLQLNYTPLVNSEDLRIGYFPYYDQYFNGLIDELIIYNKTLTATEVTNIYQLKPGDLYWKFSAQDNESTNMSATRFFTIGEDWKISPSDFGSVSATISTNVTIGNLTINISSDWVNTSYNRTFPFSLLNGTYETVQINVTSPPNEGSDTITLTITAKEARTLTDAAPASHTITTDLITTQSQPYLYTDFDTYPTSVTEGDTNVIINATIINQGQGHAQNVVLYFTLPTGWINTSGFLNKTVGILLKGGSSSNSINVTIPGTALTGTQKIFVNATGDNSTNNIIPSTHLRGEAKNVNVLAAPSGGAGPSKRAVTQTPPAGTTGGGGGGAVSKAPLGETIYTTETFMIKRGTEQSVPITITNLYRNATLKYIQPRVIGFMSQYITVSPALIRKLDYMEGRELNLSIFAPAYLTKEDYNLTIKITARIVAINPEVAGFDWKPLTEFRTLLFRVLEVSPEESEDKLEQARKDIQAMLDADFPTTKVNELLAQAEQAINVSDFELTAILAEKISKIKTEAFKADKLIKEVQEDVEKAKSKWLKVPETEKALALALKAFEREDFETTLQRAKDAQLTFILETKGKINIIWFLSKYWWAIILTIIILSIVSFLIYRSLITTIINQRLKNLEKEEISIKALMKEVQFKHFKEGSISTTQYNRIMAQYASRLNKIKQIMVKLRSKRVGIIKTEKEIENLEREKREIINLMKKAQIDYLKKGILSRGKFMDIYEADKIRLAEIEEEKALLKEKLEKEKITKQYKFLSFVNWIYSAIKKLFGRRKK